MRLKAKRFKCTRSALGILGRVFLTRNDTTLKKWKEKVTLQIIIVTAVNNETETTRITGTRIHVFVCFLAPV